MKSFKHLLFSSALLLLTASASAQSNSSFFNQELIVNGSADQFDSSNELLNWKIKDGYKYSMTAKQYKNADFSNEHIPSGESADSWLFCGKGNGLFDSSPSASYQDISIPESAWELIDNSLTTAYMSAKIGGYEKQNDHIQIIYSFQDQNNSPLQEITLGPVEADERNNTTQLLEKAQSVTVPAGTRKIQVTLIATETDWGSDVDGYADHISLIIKSNMLPAGISVSQTQFTQGDAVSIQYTNLPAGARIELYKDEAMLPLNQIKTIEGDLFNNSGNFDLANTLEPGKYTVKTISSEEKELTDPLHFMVKNKEYVKGDKNIFVMSDIHVMSPELLVQEGSTFEEYLATDRKLLVESERILKTIVDSVLNKKPELVLIPGDLTKDGELKSHQLVIEQLKRIAAQGIQVLVIPGNHDVNNPHALIYNGSQTEYAETVSMEKFAELYQDFGYGKAYARDKHSLSYAFEAYDNLVIIGIDACKYEENTFINQGAAEDVCVTDGRIKPETLSWICQQAYAARQKGKRVLAMMHHNLVEHFNQQASIAAPYVVENAAAIRDSFMNAGIHTVFTGHFHISDIAKDYNANKTDSIFDVATGSTVTYPCPFRQVKLNEDNTLMEISSHLLRRLPGTEEHDIHFDAYAREKLASGIAPMVDGLIHDYWPYIEQKFDEIEASLPLPGILVRPESPEALSAIVIDCFEEVGIKTYLTFSESNEHLKKTDHLMEEIKAGVDKAMKSLIAGWAQELAKDKVHEMLYPMLEEVVGSIIENKTNKGTDRENLSNDLFFNIEYPQLAGLHGDGTFENPYTDHDVALLAPYTSGWFIGEVLGSYNEDGSINSSEPARSNWAVGEKDNIIPVELPEGCIQTAVNAQEHDIIGKTIRFYGQKGIYMNQANGICKVSQVADLYTLNISNAGYTTYYTDHAVIIPEKTKAGIITQVSDTQNSISVDWNYPQGTTIPAFTGMIVQGESGEYPYIVSGSSESTPADNLLKGSLTNAPTEGSNCLFYKLTTGSNDHVGFYWGAEQGGAFENQAHKAYLALPVETAQNCKGFQLEGDETTHIDDILPENQPVDVYTVSGILLRHNVSPKEALRGLPKGIYIVNGKKIVL